jgi:hypothetical protein
MIFRDFFISFFNYIHAFGTVAKEMKARERENDTMLLFIIEK